MGIHSEITAAATPTGCNPSAVRAAAEAIVQAAAPKHDELATALKSVQAAGPATDSEEDVADFAHQITELQASILTTAPTTAEDAVHVLRQVQHSIAFGEIAVPDGATELEVIGLNNVVDFLHGHITASPSTSGNLAADINIDWMEGVDRLAQARENRDQAYAALDAASEKVDAELEGLGTHPDILLSDGIPMDADDLGKLVGLPAAVRDRLSNLIEQRRATFTDVYDKHQLIELDNVATDASHAVDEARRHLLSLDPPNWTGFLMQMRLVALHQHYVDLENPEAVRRVLSGASRVDKHRHAQEFIQLYRQACRLARYDSVTAWVEPWDANAFIDEFERHQGHYMTRRGPSYIEDEMPGYVSGADIAIKDPDRIRAYHALCGRETPPRDLTTGIVVTDIEKLAKVYEGTPEEAEGVISIVKAYRARDWMKDWPGSDMWAALEDWQKVAVKEAMLHRVDREQVRHLVEGANNELKEWPQLSCDASAAAVDDYLSQRESRECRPGEAWPIDVRAARAQVLSALSYPLAAE